MIKLVFYVSLKAPHPLDQADEIDDAITVIARARNASLDVTGALVSTNNHFAQILEGPPAAVDEVMASILHDPRHFDVTVLREATMPERWFARWSMAFAGRTSDIARQFDSMLAQLPSSPQEIDWAVDLIRLLEHPEGEEHRRRR